MVCVVVVVVVLVVMVVVVVIVVRMVLFFKHEVGIGGPLKIAHCSAVQCSAVQFGAAHCTLAQMGAGQCSIVMLSVGCCVAEGTWAGPGIIFYLMTQFSFSRHTVLG